MSGISDVQLKYKTDSIIHCSCEVFFDTHTQKCTEFTICFKANAVLYLLDSLSVISLLRSWRHWRSLL